MNRLLIGLTGAFGSGATFLADNFFVKQNDFVKCSLSDVLRSEYRKTKGQESCKRHELQEFGNVIRSKDASVLAELLDERVIKQNPETDYIIDSIRNPAEIKYFRDKYPEFILIGVFADYEVRWERVKDTYNGSKDRFDADEQKDKGSFEPSYGQRISDCFFESDLIFSNNDPLSPGSDDYTKMGNNIKARLCALRSPIDSTPTIPETLMAAAYISGRKSRCIKRKVGAVITDKYDQIISSGYNAVPRGLRECSSQYGNCYRDKMRDIISKRIYDQIGQPSADESLIRKNIKLLEMCRALHGEESAIINLVGRGVDLDDSTIYVTTFPCNLCANKIVQAGIKKVVYFEPYPVEEAKRILEAGHVEYRPFEGVTFRAFFKFYQYEAG